MRSLFKTPIYLPYNNLEDQFSTFRWMVCSSTIVSLKYVKLQFALDNSNYAKLPIIVRRHLNFFMDQHKIDLDNHMKLIQGVEKYVQKVVEALRAMASKCQLDELRIFKTHDCARNRATTSRYLTVPPTVPRSYQTHSQRNIEKRFSRNY